jgi:glycyl-tRNA synthetase beta chain
VGIDELSRLETKRGAWLVFRTQKSGETASALIPDCIRTALAHLPVSKRMRWGEGDAEFVRPVHWLTVIHGKTLVRCQILGVDSGMNSHGHRFLADKPVRIASADGYVKALKTNGFVIPDFDERRNTIRRQVESLGKKAGGTVIIEENLLDIVTGLVEWPRALVGDFDPAFLEIPREVLISSMRDHQKFFHLVDGRGRLLPKFITVCNIKSHRFSSIRSGNERVLRARLADARFFWEEDCNRSLEHWVENLRGVRFQAHLGSLYDKTNRIKKLAGSIAVELGWDESRVLRSAHLCKADLVSQMVSEFPSLQGTMGHHYARQTGETKEVSLAIEEHYLPKHAGDRLPTSRPGKILALADRIDTLVGIFSTGEEPTGERDPYGLRRAALGMIRILVEKKLPLDLTDLVDLSISGYVADGHTISDPVRDRVTRFITERYRKYYEAAGFANDEINAVVEVGVTRPVDFDRRLRAISRFRRNRAAQSLAEANKRIRNILRKTDQQVPLEIDNSLFEHIAEESLAAALVEISAAVGPLLQRGDYIGALGQLARLREPVDYFFAEVMVLVDNPALRANRLALLNQLSNLLFVVADMSRLQPTT